MSDFPKIEKFNLEIEKLVQTQDLDALNEVFYSAEELVEYSNNVLIYPYKKDSVLAMFAKTANVDFFNQFWEHYFSAPKDKDLAIEFLQGTTMYGRKINYHYFKDSLSDKDKLKARYFVTKDRTTKAILANKIINSSSYIRDKEQRDRAEFYYNLRDKYAELGGKLTEPSPHSLELKNDDQIIENIKGGNFIWQRDFNKIEKLEFRHLPTKDNKFDYVSDINDIDLDKPLLKQVFNKLDFPDLFYKDNYDEVLARLEYVYNNYSKTKEHNDLAIFSRIKKDVMVIENITNKEHEDISESYYAIYNNNTRRTILNAEYIERDNKDLLVTTIHENTHSLDFSLKTLSLSDRAIYPALTFMIIENDLGLIKNQKLKKLVDNAMDYKEHYSWPVELLPRLMSEDFGNDKLAKNVVKLVNILNRYTNKGDISLINRYKRINKNKSPELFYEVSTNYLYNKEFGSISEDKEGLEKVVSDYLVPNIVKHFADERDPFDTKHMRVDIVNKIDGLFDAMVDIEKKFEGREHLKKVDIVPSFYDIESQIVPDKGLIEEFYDNTAQKTQEFYNNKGQFVPQRFLDELQSQVLKAEGEKRPKEKRKEIARVYILVNETYKKLELKLDRKFDLEKNRTPFVDERNLHKHLQIINKGLVAIRCDINKYISKHKYMYNDNNIQTISAANQLLKIEKTR